LLTPVVVEPSWQAHQLAGRASRRRRKRCKAPCQIPRPRALFGDLAAINPPPAWRGSLRRLAVGVQMARHALLFAPAQALSHPPVTLLKASGRE
jgi:hypothetical protein